jgi:hypothetical protein
MYASSGHSVLIARRTLHFLNEAGVNISPWPARSPDLNPIEHIWDIIERRLTTLHRLPQTLAQLQHEIQLAWDQVPPHFVNAQAAKLMYPKPKLLSKDIVFLCNYNQKKKTLNRINNSNYTPR